MSIFNVTDSVEPILKQFYSSVYEDLAYRDHALMGLVSKEHGSGEVVKQAMKYGNTAGRGAAFSTAQANSSDSARVAFLITSAASYAVQQVKNTDIELASDDAGSIVRLLTDAMEGAMRGVSDDLERDLFGDGFGTLGYIVSNTGTYILTIGASGTVANAQPAINFYVNQVLVSAVANNSSSLDTGTALVTAVDRDAGTVTVTAVGGWTPTNTHALFNQADKPASATPQKIAGLAAWLPLTAPTSAAFFGVDRSVDPQLLGGVRIDGRSQGTLVTVINTAAQRLGTIANAKPDLVVMSYTNFGLLLALLDTKARYVDVQGKDIDVLYRGVEIMGPKGPMTVHPAAYCPDDRLYVLTSNTWTLYSPGNEPIKTANRNKFVDVYNADSVELRFRYLCYFGCSAPGFNAVVQLA